MTEQISIGRTLEAGDPDSEEAIQEVRDRTQQEVNRVIAALETRIKALEDAP